MLRSSCLKAKQTRSILPIAHAYILCMALLTPLTLSPSTDLFDLCRIFQTLLMGQYVLLSPLGNKKLKALLRGTFLHRFFFFSSIDDLVAFTGRFFDGQAVYLRFSHVPIFNRSFTLAPRRPLFWTGSTPDSESFCRFNKTNLSWLKLPRDFGTNMTTSGCGLFSRCTPVNPTCGFWNKPQFNCGSLA